MLAKPSVSAGRLAYPPVDGCGALLFEECIGAREGFGAEEAAGS